MIATLSGGSRAVAPGTQVCLSACPSMIIGRIWSQRKVIRGRGGLVRGLRRLIQILGGLIWGQTPDFERTDLRPESADLRPKTTERLDLRSMRPDLRSERPDMRPGRPHGGGTNRWMDGRMNGRMNEQKLTSVLQDFVPFRVAAQKVARRNSLLYFKCRLKLNYLTP